MKVFQFCFLFGVGVGCMQKIFSIIQPQR